MILLPAIDLYEGKVVRLTRGDYSRMTVYREDPLDQAREFEIAGAAWLHTVDLEGARDGTTPNFRVVAELCRSTGLQVEVGGGIRSLDTIARLADAGVSRVVLGTSLVADPAFAEAAVQQYAKLLTAGIDAKGGEVAVSGWREGSGVAAEELARHVSQLGFRHLIYTDISRDGMQTGIEAQAYVRMAQAFGHPVVASGGVAGVADIERLAPVAASIEGVIAGRAIYEGALSVAEGVRACEAATRAAEAAAVQANPCGAAPRTRPAIGPDDPHPAPVMPC